jgi:hypothetical protein
MDWLPRDQPRRDDCERSYSVGGAGVGARRGGVANDHELEPERRDSLPNTRREAARDRRPLANAY